MMHPEVRKEYDRLEKEFGIVVNEEIIKKTTNDALADLLKKMLKAGASKERFKRMLKSAKPLGDFAWFQKQLSDPDFQKFFGGPVRNFAIDGSRTEPAFGASSTGEINNCSPYGNSATKYDEYMGIKKPITPELKIIFDSGHWMEPVLRHYFSVMYQERYVVIECDIQWEYRKGDYFIGNVDGLLYDKETGQFGLLEIKHTTANNVKVQKAVQSGNVPIYWDMQERSYMELLDLDFACLFLGWGNRPGLETNAMHRIERDQALGESILEQCEDFMVNNVKAHIRPSVKNIKNPEQVKESIEKLYGPMDPKKKLVEFDEGLKSVFDKLAEKQSEIDALKEAKKEAEKKVEEAEAEFEALSLPVIEELKTAREGVYKDKDGTNYYVSYDIPSALDIEALHDQFPEVYDKYNKLSVDTAALKRERPDIYRDCYGPKKGGKRKFKFKAYKR